eukprot:18736-Heterococcus_DN1.PRE.5
MSCYSSLQRTLTLSARKGSVAMTREHLLATEALKLLPLQCEQILKLSLLWCALGEPLTKQSCVCSLAGNASCRHSTIVACDTPVSDKQSTWVSCNYIWRATYRRYRLATMAQARLKKGLHVACEVRLNHTALVAASCCRSASG